MLKLFGCTILNIFSTIIFGKNETNSNIKKLYKFLGTLDNREYNSNFIDNPIIKIFESFSHGWALPSNLYDSNLKTIILLLLKRKNLCGLF